MPESALHRNLVELIIQHIEETYDISKSEILVDGTDTGMSMPNGVIPDVLSSSKGYAIIGEAKIGSDIVNEHTEKQFKEYLCWCDMKRRLDDCDPLIIYAVPPDYLKTAKNYLDSIRTKSNHNDIMLVVKTIMGTFSTENPEMDSKKPCILFRNEKPLHAKIEAFDYQRKAVETIKKLDYSAIFHEQGLGKTKIAIDLMLYWFSNNVLDSVVIVTKKSLVTNWEKELKIHTDLSTGIVGIHKGDNYYVFNSPNRVIITNFEAFSKEEERFELLPKCRVTGIIIDESAKIKNPLAKITKSLHKLSPLYKKRVIMSGTPIANRPYDIWSQIFFLDQGKSLGDDFNTFKSNTDLSNKLAVSKTLQEEFTSAIGDIFDKISHFTVRETKNSGIINLPPKEYHVLDVVFEKKQEEMYHKVLRDVSCDIVKDGVLIIDDVSEIIKRLTRLMMITSNPALVDESYTNTPSKLFALMILLDEIIQRDEKAIVWTAFRGNVTTILEKASKYNPVAIHGGMTMEERDVSVEKFKNDSNVKIMVATNAAKEGLTLTVANNAIFYDRTLNLDDYLQAQDRIHRISQTETCHIYNIKIMGSIDEWVDKLVESKTTAAKFAQNDITLDEYNDVMDYSFGEMITKILEDNNGH